VAIANVRIKERRATADSRQTYAQRGVRRLPDKSCCRTTAGRQTRVKTPT
jgi:hypothetical protein